MSLFPAPILTNGATHSAQQFRMLVRDLARGSEGITEGDDLQVSQRSVPGGGVTVGDGSAVIQGRDDAFQGHYAACNVGAVDVDIAATGSTGRSDMLILRIEDPEYTGTLDPEVDQIAYFQVISGVSSAATTIPDGRTGIPLARIDIPPLTGTITSEMITDLRKIANPRRDRSLYTQSPASISTQIGGSSNSYAYFSTAAGWTITVPSWASTVKIRLDIAGLRLTAGNIFGSVRAMFGTERSMQPVIIDDNQGAVTRRLNAIVADTLTIPSSYRGTSQLLRAQFAGHSGNVGTVSVDSSSTLIADVEFFEAPR
ncbi:hypothetical protein [Streptomyces sp. NPDC048521]|uniref:hypothetical protein n=1 Tax=Streptomyces sp. NPDC048521 TaxID=3365566 RepID=UPI00371A021E